MQREQTRAARTVDAASALLGAAVQAALLRLCALVLLIAVFGCVQTSDQSEPTLTTAPPTPTNSPEPHGSTMCFGYGPEDTAPPQPDSFVQFSPDSDRLILGSWKHWYWGKKTGILAIDLRTGATYEIIDTDPDNRGNIPYAEVSPTSVIAYNSCEYVSKSTGERDTEIALIDMDGQTQRRLTQTDDDEYFPSWSPDGSLLAFVSARSYLQYTDEHGVTIMDAQGNRKAHVNSAILHPPAWSPDSSQLAFFRSDAIPQEAAVLGGYAQHYSGHIMGYPLAPISLYIMTPETADDAYLPRIVSTIAPTRPSTRLSAYLGGPAWSPDGAQIAYSSVSSAGYTNAEIIGAQIQVIDSDGTDPRVVWAGSWPGAITQIIWLPNGKELLSVFTVGMSHSGSKSCGSVAYIIDTNSGDVRHFSVPVPMCNMRASLSPDGTEVALYDGGESAVVIGLDGTNPRILELTP